MPLLNLILVIVLIFVIFQTIIRILRKMWHFPAPAFIGRFLDSDYRRRMQPPDLLIRRSGIEPGMKILEVGCGSGAYTAHVAETAGKDGQVVAFDIQFDMLKQLSAKLERAEFSSVNNIDIIRGDALNLPFTDNYFDCVYMVTVLQEIPDNKSALAECRRVIKDGGFLAVTELLADPDYPIKSTTIRMGEAAGFIVDAVSGSIWNYTVRFMKNDAR